MVTNAQNAYRAILAGKNPAQTMEELQAQLEGARVANPDAVKAIESALANGLEIATLGAPITKVEVNKDQLPGTPTGTGAMGLDPSQLLKKLQYRDDEMGDLSPLSWQRVQERSEAVAKRGSEPLQSLYRTLVTVMTNMKLRKGMAHAVYNDLNQFLSTASCKNEAVFKNLEALERNELKDYLLDAITVLAQLKGFRPHAVKLFGQIGAPKAYREAAAKAQLMEVGELPDPILKKRHDRLISVGGKDLRRGDRVFFKPNEDQEPIEVQVRDAFGGQLHVMELGGYPRKPHIIELEAAADQILFQVSEEEDPVGRYQKPDDQEVFTNRIASNVSLDKDGQEPILRVGTQALFQGDFARYYAWTGEEEADTYLQIRAIREQEDGSPEVVVDEYLSPGRLRTRLLLPGEIGLLERNDLSEMIQPFFSWPEELRVSGYPADFDSNPAFRLGDEIFLAGDRAQLAGQSVRIVSIAAGDEAYPSVIVETDQGMRELTKEEVAQLQIDKPAMGIRTGSDPRPDLEVVRLPGQDPFLSMKGERVAVGDAVLFDRGTPGTVPMILERMERKDDKEVVWITEPVALGNDDKDKATYEKIELGGEELRVRCFPPVELLTRPLGEYEYHLMYSKKAHENRGGYNELNIQDGGFALMRAHSGLHYNQEGKVLLVRDHQVRPGDELVYRRGDETNVVKVLEIDEEKVKIERNGEERWLEKPETLFLFPS